MKTLDLICGIIIKVFGALVFYKGLLTVIGFFVKSKKYKETDKQYTYGIIIAARNEEKVIGNLIDSIRKQTYNQDLIKIFVVSDNSTDNTASVCRSKDVIVYERFNREQVSKGYALEFLFSNIQRDYGITSFDNYIFFDADNLLDKNYIYEINKALASGQDIVTGYRNTKNFDTNFISASYGICFYRQALGKHRPRSFLGTGSQLSGTGYAIRSELIKDGWIFHSLTEDAELTMHMVDKGYKVGYCEAAEFYDEQPTSFKVSFRQRLRWEKGKFNNFFKYGGKLFKDFFKRFSFTCYDIFFTYFPYNLVTMIIGIIYPITSLVYSFIQGNYNIVQMLTNIGLYYGTLYFSALFSGIITVIREHKHINCSFWKMVFFIILWPWFDLFTLPLLIIAIFSKITWKPIVHNDSRTIEDLDKKKPR